MRSNARKTKATAKARNGVKSGRKRAMIVGLLTRPEGCTSAEILSACRWPAVSVPQQAKAAGLRLKKKKEGRVTRYWAA